MATLRACKYRSTYFIIGHGCCVVKLVVILLLCYCFYSSSVLLFGLSYHNNMATLSLSLRSKSMTLSPLLYYTWQRSEYSTYFKNIPLLYIQYNAVYCYILKRAERGLLSTPSGRILARGSFSLRVRFYIGILLNFLCLECSGPNRGPLLGSHGLCVCYFMTAIPLSGPPACMPAIF